MKKGPEFKMPEIKVPDFILDIYYDLRERHLLPLVAILLVAIVALPILLSSSSSDSPEPEEAVATLSTIPSSKLIVAKATPGLRDYHHRLAGTPKDPFEQQYKTSEDEGSATESVPVTESSPSGGAESPPTSTESPPTETSSPEPSQSGQTNTPNHGNGEPPSNGQLKYYSFAIDVRVVPVSSGDGKAKAEPTTRRNLPELTMLPGRKEPALTFMSVSKDENKALMLVSDKVTGLFGDGVCVVGAEHCQLLALEPGVPETVVYGPQGHSFRIELLKIRLLSTDKLHKAPLSKSEEKEDKPKGSGG